VSELSDQHQNPLYSNGPKTAHYNTMMFYFFIIIAECWFYLCESVCV